MHKVTLREALQEFNQKNSKIFSFRDSSPGAKKFFQYHDTAHVIFGCDTSLVGEAHVKLWTIFGSTLGFWKHLKGYKEANALQLFSGYSFKQVLKSLLMIFLTLPTVISRAIRMTKRWPWSDYDKYLDVPVSSIRKEFSINSVDMQKWGKWENREKWGAQSEYVCAGFWIRSLAALIDILLLTMILAVPLTYIYGMNYWIDTSLFKGYWYVVLSFVVPVILTLWLWLMFKATPGKMLLGLEIVDAKTGGKMSLKQAIVRYFAYILSSVFVMLGFVWIAFDKQKQAWHDRLANSVVIYKSNNDRNNNDRNNNDRNNNDRNNNNKNNKQGKES